MLKVYITVEGLENLANGRDLMSWNYVIREAADIPPKDYFKCAEFEPKYPKKEECITPVMKKFEEMEKDVHLEAHKALADINERRQTLLALTND
jgi:hypothetical protein